jgi:transposase
MQAKTILASVPSRDLPGRTRRELAVELVAEVQALDDKLKQLTRRLRQAVTATGSGLTDLYGIESPRRVRRLQSLRRMELWGERASTRRSCGSVRCGWSPR